MPPRKKKKPQNVGELRESGYKVSSIREELRNGLNPLAAISAGYDRAFTTIVDANVTTLIVAVVLFAVSSTSIKLISSNVLHISEIGFCKPAPM